MMRKDTDFSSRRRCSQPAIATRSPMRSGSWADSTREIITTPYGYVRTLGRAGDKGTRGSSALSPPPGAAFPPAGSGLVGPGDGGRPTGHRARRRLRLPVLPARRSVFAARSRGRLLSFRRLSAAVGASCPRALALLVSVSALLPRIAEPATRPETLSRP